MRRPASGPSHFYRLVDLANDLNLLAWVGEPAIWCRLCAAVHWDLAFCRADFNLKLVIALFTVPDFRGHTRSPLSVDSVNQRPRRRSIPYKAGVMRALYEAPAPDLGTEDLVKVECICGHTELLRAGMLTTAGVKPFQNILDLEYKLRCRECDRRGRVVISIKWDMQAR